MIVFFQTEILTFQKCVPTLMFNPVVYETIYWYVQMYQIW